MNRPRDTLRCGAFAGLALLVAFSALADEPLREAVREQLRDENYLLIEDQDGARLFVFSTGNVTTVTARRDVGATGPLNKALEMTRSTDPALRVRGLTLLSGVDDAAALDAALVLLSDPEAAVREEAVQLVFEHPGADIESAAAVASRDPSPRVREAVAELASERSNDPGD